MTMERRQIWDPLRKKLVALTPEEEVRQWFIGVLRDSFNVPAHLMMSEASLKLGQKVLRADLLVWSSVLKPLLVVECKREDVEIDRKVLEQVLGYNLVLDVPYLAVTNGRKTLCFERDGSAFRQIPTLPDWTLMKEATQE